MKVGVPTYISDYELMLLQNLISRYGNFKGSNLVSLNVKVFRLKVKLQFYFSFHMLN